MTNTFESLNCMDVVPDGTFNSLRNSNAKSPLFTAWLNLLAMTNSCFSSSTHFVFGNPCFEHSDGIACDMMTIHSDDSAPVVNFDGDNSFVTGRRSTTLGGAAVLLLVCAGCSMERCGKIVWCTCCELPW